MIEFQHIQKDYENETALQDLSLTVQSHELFVLVGPSGSGKTTLLKTVNRIVVPTSGQVLLDGQDVAAGNLQTLRQHIGYVLQSSALFPNMTVQQNAGVQLEALGWPKDKIAARVRELLTRVDLDPAIYAGRMPAELSGGEAQRVGIVRALAGKPNLILMDEPFSALDPVSKRQLQDLILKLHAETHTTVIFVTHDMQEAVRLADRLAVIHAGQLQQVGTPEEILQAPATDFVANFFASVDNGQSLAQVVATGLGSVDALATATELPASATIYTWAQLLREHPNQNVRVGARVLVPADLISYLAQMGKEENDA